MDFLKDCSTNVTVVDDILKTCCHAYRPTEDVADAIQRRHIVQRTIAKIREGNGLCAAEEDEIWLFGDVTDELTDLLGDFDTYEKGTLETLSGGSANSIFLNAIEGAIAFAFAGNTSVSHIAPCTWLYMSKEDEDEDEENDYVSSNRLLIRLHVRITPAGSLYMMPDIVPTSWKPVDDFVHLEEATQLLMAPAGRHVTLAPVDTGDVLSDDNWKALVTRTLEAEGISLPSEMPWLAVYQSWGATYTGFTWPENLCLIWDVPPTSSDQDVPAEVDCHRWFANTDGPDAFRDPLALAEEWFNGAVVREREIGEVEDVESSEDMESDPLLSGDMQDGTNEDNLMTPPLLNQRLSEQQATIAGIYPTPPDGLTHVISSSQFNSVTTPAITPGDLPATISDMLATGDETQLGHLDRRASLNEEGYQLGQEDLFGDGEEMEFGEEVDDVDDIDFSFFDQPDNDPAIAVDHVDMLETFEQVDQDISGDAFEDMYPDTMEIVDGPAVDETIPAQSDGGTQEEYTELGPSGETTMPTTWLDNGPSQLRKPLSPFGIREHLLPPPVPASLAHNDSTEIGDGRRNGTFGPVTFRDNLKLDYRYDDVDFVMTRNETDSKKLSVPDISLPPTRKKHRLLKNKMVHPGEKETVVRDEDSSETSSSDLETEPAENLAWAPETPHDYRKRKRADFDHIASSPASLLGTFGSTHKGNGEDGTPISSSEMLAVLDRCLEPGNTSSLIDRAPVSSSKTDNDAIVAKMEGAVHDIYGLRKDDLIYIAQIIGDQAATALHCLASARDMQGFAEGNGTTPVLAYVYQLFEQSIRNALPDSESCDLSKVALIREPMAPQRSMSNTSKVPHQPRPPQRGESTVVGPDYFPLPPPHIKIQRGTDNWEMLPTSLLFWDMLGLGPAGGAKNVQAFCVFPHNEDLQHLVENFMAEVGTAYESCKLGSHVHLRDTNDKDNLDSFENGLAPVEPDRDMPLKDALKKAYENTCVDLGKVLSGLTFHETNRTIVVYMVNPFPDQQGRHYLCACFWLLFKAYKDNLPKTHRSLYGSDVVLQLIPISLIADYDSVVVVDSKQMALLVREVYDRCPPIAPLQKMANTSMLPILAAPAVELAAPAPKRINFQLIAEPPGDLLHEGSILHLAYALSQDGEWLTAAWIDNTAQYQATASFCLRGRTFAEIAEDVWERTREIMAARQVFWRVFIATYQEVDSFTSRCWSAISSKPRPQPLCVTLLTVDFDPGLRITAPPSSDVQSPWQTGQDTSFPTPASTPQGANTSSPDGSGPAAATPNTAPPTPAPSEITASIGENDPDAYLVDVADETFGVLFSPKMSSLINRQCTGLANGALFRRGDAGDGAALESMGVSLLWIIQVKPGGTVDDGSVKQAELTIRDVMRMFRSLGVLATARGLGWMPVHVVAAKYGAEGLDGMLRRNSHSTLETA